MVLKVLQCSEYAYERMHNPGPTLSDAVLVIAYIYLLPPIFLIWLTTKPLSGLRHASVW